LIGPFLQITKTKIPVHPNGQNKDYGYVEFGSDEDMQAALKNNAGVSGCG
jgi:RNA recognition motif-containing protein